LPFSAKEDRVLSFCFGYFLLLSFRFFVNLPQREKKSVLQAHWGEAVSPKGEESRIERIFSKLLKTHFALLLPAPGLGSALG
jgi:hypothetical protein